MYNNHCRGLEKYEDGIMINFFFLVSYTPNIISGFYAQEI
jgi:hypothetical protein